MKNDAARGRIYLPLSELKKFNVSEAEILASKYSDRFARSPPAWPRAPRSFYRLAQQSLPPEDRQAMVAAELMGSVYWRLLQKLERQAFHVFGPTPPRLSKGHKLALIFQSWLRHVVGRHAAAYGCPVNGRRPAPWPSRRRLIVNADDFGRSPSVNAAVVRAHRDGHSDLGQPDGQ